MFLTYNIEEANDFEVTFNIPDDWNINTFNQCVSIDYDEEKETVEINAYRADDSAQHYFSRKYNLDDLEDNLIDLVR